MKNLKRLFKIPACARSDSYRMTTARLNSDNGNPFQDLSRNEAASHLVAIRQLRIPFLLIKPGWEPESTLLLFFIDQKINRNTKQNDDKSWPRILLFVNQKQYAKCSAN